MPAVKGTFLTEETGKSRLKEETKKLIKKVMLEQKTFTMLDITPKDALETFRSIDTFHGLPEELAAAKVYQIINGELAHFRQKLRIAVDNNNHALRENGRYVFFTPNVATGATHDTDRDVPPGSTLVPAYLTRSKWANYLKKVAKNEAPAVEPAPAPVVPEIPVIEMSEAVDWQKVSLALASSVGTMAQQMSALVEAVQKSSKA